MTVTITISGATATEALAEFEDLAAAFFAGRVASATEARLIDAEAVRAQQIAAGDAPPAGATNVTPAEEKPKRTRKTKAPEERQISSQPEMRVDPAEEAQDEADEAEESAAAAPAEEVTHDTIRQALGQYGKVYGMPAVMEDGPKLIEFPKVSDIPDDQDALQAALGRIMQGIEQNPFKRAKEAA
jgi:hypothetical protein